MHVLELFRLSHGTNSGQCSDSGAARHRLCTLGLFVSFLFNLAGQAWDENFGQMATEGQGLKTSLLLLGAFPGDVEETRVTEAAASRTWNLELVLLGLAITCLEGSMYCFVFNWTPSLETPAVARRGLLGGGVGRRRHPMGWSLP